MSITPASPSTTDMKERTQIVVEQDDHEILPAEVFVVSCIIVGILGYRVLLEIIASLL